MVAKAKMSKSSNWCGVLLTIVLVTLLSTIHVHAQAVEVELTAYAPATDNTVTLCPDHKFELVFECLVRDANDISWKLPPLIQNSESHIFNDQTPITERKVNNITIIFIIIMSEKISLLQVPTGDIIREIGIDDNLTVSCLATNLTTINKTIDIRISDGIAEIDSATYDISTNELNVTWSTNMTNVITVAVIVKSSISETETIVIVGWDETNASIIVEPSPSYNVTVRMFNSCRQTISSQPLIVTGISTTSSFMETTFNTVLLAPTTALLTSTNSIFQGTPNATVTSSLCTPDAKLSPSPDNKAQNEVAIVEVIVIAVLLSIYNSY